MRWFYMTSTSSEFAGYLESSWHHASARVRFREEPLFQAFTDSIMALSHRYRIEEFHGSKHQVAFGSTVPWRDGVARCELSDLLIITYKLKPKLDIRMTLLQAKKSKASIDLCSDYPKFRNHTEFKATYEQWNLLSRRPWIIGAPPFDPPANLIRGALLPSIGTFGVFHPIHTGGIGFFYSVAGELKPNRRKRVKHPKLKTLKGPAYRTIQGHDELRMACCIYIFGEALYDGRIGTPLDRSNLQSQADEKYRDETREWLLIVLSSHVTASEADTPVTRRLIQAFEDRPDTIMPKHQLPHIIIINNDDHPLDEG